MTKKHTHKETKTNKQEKKANSPTAVKTKSESPNCSTANMKMIYNLDSVSDSVASVSLVTLMLRI